MSMVKYSSFGGSLKDMSLAETRYGDGTVGTNYVFSIIEADSGNVQEATYGYTATGSTLIGQNIKLTLTGTHQITANALNGYYLYYYKPTGNTGNPPFVESLGINGSKTVSNAYEGWGQNFIATKQELTITLSS